mgnify:CR=1 FL=1
MEYNPLCYKPDDVKRFVLERCITAQEGLEMLMDMENELLLPLRVLAFSLNGRAVNTDYERSETVYRM